MGDLIELPTARLPDAEARRRIVEELETNFLVEAGAGSGKTTALVGRMVALVAGGAPVESLAAVTFTRKAASELRERFQESLEAALRAAREGGEPEAESLARLDAALRDVDRAFIGTIHAFCARLLRERPLEARLDPAFEETLEDEEVRRAKRFWATWVERLAADGAPGLAALRRVGLGPDDVDGLFLDMIDQTDVDFVTEAHAPPDPGEVEAVRSELERLLDRGLALMPDEEHPKGADDLQKKLRSIAFKRRVMRWRSDDVFFDALTDLCEGGTSITQYKWADDKPGKDRAKRFKADVDAFAEEGSRAWRLLESWWAHRYPVVVRFVRAAVDAYERQRRAEGRLSFHDLLDLTRGLLVGSPDARRDLGERYRRLLVDEFQDTDPIQAELLLLLASDPDEGDRWREVSPRPGALFVVGDPKQSIYRFRRADIGIYGFVRRRFETFGAVLELTANFRSREAIGELVNDVFEHPDRFGPRATAYQAPFAPLLVRPGEEVPPTEGVFWYGVDARRKGDVIHDDAERLAAWIAERTGPNGDRRPDDFLILTETKKGLHAYARSLERRNLPVQVSGAGIGVERDLLELLVVLRALADPGDEVATVAALTGRFFGVDPESLLAHRLAGGRFDFRTAGRRGEGGASGDAGGEPGVSAALERLREWWWRSRSEPADVVVGRIAESVGLVPWAAAGELGQVRAGALLYALDAVRAAGLAGDTSLQGAVEAIEAAHEAREAEAPLEPGRSGAVRVMNLHKAKGLEAPVVVLARPTRAWEKDADSHVERGDGGESRGWLVVRKSTGPYSSRTLARPPGWNAREAEELRYLEAEQVRLLYVAATRPRHELVVARWEKTDHNSPWAPLHAWLKAHGTELEEMERRPPPERQRLERTAAEMLDDVRRVEEERAVRARPGHRFETVTGLAKGGGGGPAPGRAGAPRSGSAAPTPAESPEPPPAAGPAAAGDPQIDLFAAGSGEARPAGAATPDRPVHGEAVGRAAPDGPAPVHPDDDEGLGPELDADHGLHRGADWGSAVHAALEAAARGAGEAAVRAVGRAHLLEYERPVGHDGEPLELDGLVRTVDAVLDSPLWDRARSAGRVLAEVPFALPWGEDDDGVPVSLDGVVDLAFREDDGWVLVDYKTDVDPEPSRVRAYEAQLALYAAAWEKAAGEPVKERHILWTRR